MNSFVDILVSPNYNPSVSKILYKLMPRPTKMIYPYNDLNTVVKKRPDHPREDLLRQKEIYERLSFDKRIKTRKKEQATRRMVDEILKD